MANDIFEQFNEWAWRDTIRWCFANTDIRQQFEAATKTPAFTAADIPIDVMVDKVCEVKDSYMDRFVIWATENYWGIEFAPQRFKDRYGPGTKLAEKEKR